MTALPRTGTDPAPTVFSAGVAVATAVGSAFASTLHPLPTAALVVEAVGVSLFCGGVVLRRGGRSRIGVPLTVVGFGIAVAAIVGVVSVPLSLLVSLAIVLCASGVLVLTFGVFPVTPRWARWLSLAGITLLFLGVLLNGVLADLGVARYALAVTLVLVSWDASARAVTLGDQLGAHAGTASVEIVETGAVLAVGGAAVAITVAAARLSIGRPSMLGLALVLAAAVLLLASLYRAPA